MQTSLNQKPVSQGCCPTLLFIKSSQQSHNNSTTKPRNSSSHCRQTFASTSSSIFPNTKFTNHESLPSLHESFTEFIKVYPQFSETEKIDSLRAKEYYHLSFLNQSCLDYIGIGLFSYYQRQQHDASKTQFSSPSTSTPFQSPQQYSDIPFFSISYKTGNLKTLLLHGGKESEFESAMRKRIMKFLNISENDYFMVFTANRTSAFKLVADSYPFQSCKKLLTVYDYESEAVEAMISTSENRGAKSMSAEFSWPRLRIQSTKLKKMIVSDNSKKKIKKKNGLFVFPLHSRVTGARYPYLWMRTAQENGWHVLIDACALGPKDMDSFGLSLFQPDFLICSFYKVFGENPSGFGCLFVKKSSISILESSTCAGIVNLVPESTQFNLSEDSSCNNQVGIGQKSPSILQEQELSALSSFSGRMQTPQFVKVEADPKAPLGSETMEARVVENNQVKTVQDSKNESFNIECRCLDQVDSLGLTLITNRGRYLINWLVNSLLKLKHPNDEGVPLVKIYGPKIRFDRGPALAFNVYDWKGEKVEPVLVQKLADRNNISLSYGFLHHIWFADKYSEGKGRVLQTKEGRGEKVMVNKKKDRDDLGVTVVTAALSFLANFEDVYKLWTFVARFLDADFVEKERWRLNMQTISRRKKSVNPSYYSVTEV
ncbi:molybdenum cofactor sulfurase isoform X2 [Medicago truncatula]|uniref:molybdenum cofactor sulfurase isoform X2 n=1 Tax=Medicago truncatula TaxID=3880 RepID=UPI000D2F1F47|nr:molybdenum cofactor sulfurase isoform X2 [Medicago truncatula]